jgi:hypothetical protein
VEDRQLRAARVPQASPADSLERRTVWLPSGNRGLASHRVVASPSNTSSILGRRASRCSQLHDLPRSAKPFGVLVPRHTGFDGLARFVAPLAAPRREVARFCASIEGGVPPPSSGKARQSPPSLPPADGRTAGRRRLWRLGGTHLARRFNRSNPLRRGTRFCPQNRGGKNLDQSDRLAERPRRKWREDQKFDLRL